MIDVTRRTRIVGKNQKITLGATLPGVANPAGDDPGVNDGPLEEDSPNPQDICEIGLPDDFDGLEAREDIEFDPCAVLCLH